MSTNQNDELNLEPLVNKALSGVKNASNSFRSFRKKAWDNKIRIGSITFLFAGIGLILALLIKPYYKVNMAVTASKTGVFYLKQSIVNLNYLLEEKNYSAFSSKVDLTEAQGEEVRSLEAIYSSSLSISDDTTENIHLYYITAEVYNQSFLNQLDTGIFSYVENNKIVRKTRQSKRETKLKTIEGLEKDLVKVDSLLNQITNRNTFSSGNNTFVLKEPINATELIQEKNRLFNLKLKYEESIKNGDDLQRFRGFDAQVKPAFPKKTWFTLAGAAIGLIVSLFLISPKNKD
jgi:hypothetical protein